MKKSLAHQRVEYTLNKLDEKDINPDPFLQFQKWYEEILKSDADLSNAMILSTSDLNGKPSSRLVLLKGVEKNGFQFYTNYLSRKGKNLVVNPCASLLFFWPGLERQIRIEGVVEKLSSAESSEYFSTRPRESQISAVVSNQSGVIPDRSFLEKRFEEINALYQGKKIPRPDHWGGFRLIPDYFEFWQGRANRLHDRIIYSKENQDWIVRRLSP